MGTVIKAGGLGRVTGGLQSFGLKDHMAEAHAVVRDAHDRADRVIQEAERRAAELLEEAHRTGFARGHIEGVQAGRREGAERAHADAIGKYLPRLEQLSMALDNAVSAIDEREESLIERANQDLLSFAVLLAGRIAKQIGRVDRQAAVANAKEAIRQIVGPSDMVIKIHRDDAATMQSFAADFMDDVSCRRSVRVVEDASVEPGGCIVESTSTTVDATLQTQLERAADLLLGSHGIVRGDDAGEENRDGGDV